MNKTDVYFTTIVIILAIGALILGGVTEIKHAPAINTETTKVEQTTSYKLVVEINTYKKMYR